MVVEDVIEGDGDCDGRAAREHQDSGGLRVRGRGRGVQRIAAEVVLADDIADHPVAVEVLECAWRNGVGVHRHAGQLVAGDVVALDQVVIRGGTGPRIRGTGSGALALNSPLLVTTLPRMTLL